MFAEDVLTCGDVVVVDGVVGGVVVGVVGGVVGVVVVGGDVTGVVVGDVTGTVGGDVAAMVGGDVVTGGEVACVAGAVEAGHVTLDGSGPTPPDGAAFRPTVPAEFAAPPLVPAPTVWPGPGPREGGMYPGPLDWWVIVVPPEPWLRHWVLPGGMVARNGIPAMCEAVPSRVRVAPLDWGTPAPAPPLPPLEPWPELLPKALSSCAPTVARSRGIESITPRTRSKAAAVASAGRNHELGVRSA